ncbi:hypothetical protein SANBI_002662 [Sanguibacter sp. 4.1]|uniref:Asp23/Gls24 family envelope stress response protein n=1 Tax=Sanguibacter biliveldensis TaxID=3030830 RepID=A0AAF0Z1Z6_9MICO|nr:MULTISPECIES: hypothetical protein [unclassified Sanguibacter]KQU00189.1 hypothetical protein ASG53_04860 [Sanguibacter sp. Leaf3]WPF81372.1 hypothetical protein SANBI_002662 [Sanguibacter sp. 4.1]
MAMSERPSSRLACGRDMDAVWDRIGSPPDEHERGCPHCEQARRDLGELASLTALEREAERTAPGLEPDPAVLGRIMDVARAEVRRGRRFPLDEPEVSEPAPELTVSEQAVSASARRAGDAVPGVEVERCVVSLVVDGRGPWQASPAGVLDLRQGPDSYGRARPSRVEATLQITVPVSASIPAVAAEVRSSVRRRVSSEVGVDVVRVDIEVRDTRDV